MAYEKRLVDTTGIVHFEGFEFEYEMKQGQVFIAGNNIGRVDFFPTYEDDQARWMGTVNSKISLPSSWQAATPTHAVYMILESIKQNRTLRPAIIVAEDILDPEAVAA